MSLFSLIWWCSLIWISLILSILSRILTFHYLKFLSKDTLTTFNRLSFNVNEITCLRIDRRVKIIFITITTTFAAKWWLTWEGLGLIGLRLIDFLELFFTSYKEATAHFYRWCVFRLEIDTGSLWLIFILYVDLIHCICGVLRLIDLVLHFWIFKAL